MCGQDVWYDLRLRASDLHRSEMRARATFWLESQILPGLPVPKHCHVFAASSTMVPAVRR